MKVSFSYWQHSHRTTFPACTKACLFCDLAAMLKSDGIIVNIVSAPEIYCNEWAGL